jgi:DNA repair protein RecN (Recombination protein N)
LRFQLDELSTAAVTEGEDVRLLRERELLTNAERLIRSASEALAAIAGDATSADFDAGSLDRLRTAERAVEDIVAIDTDQEALLTRLRDALFALDDVAGQLRDYLEAAEYNPARLEDINERLDLLRRLKRKYGPELIDVMHHAATVDDELARLDLDAGGIEGLRADEREQREVLGRLAAELSERRRAAAADLATQVEQAIADLNMGRAEFRVNFSTSTDPGGVLVSPDPTPLSADATGVDRVTFMLAANAGEELRPLGRVASGGETARLMLALKSILSDADSTPTLVFDEIDVGVGGRSGQVVGEKLWRLTAHHQAIVISHLPQIAAFADRHLTLEKREIGGRTETTAAVIEGPERIEELAAMFDGLPPTPESRANATALLQRVEEWKRHYAPLAGGLP